MRKASDQGQRALVIRAANWPFVQVPSALLIDAAISDGAKLTYAYLQLWGQANGKAWPRRETLSQARGVGRSTLMGHLTELEGAGWISRYPEGRKSIIQLHPQRRAVKGSSQLDQSNPPDGPVQLAGPQVSSQLDTERDEPKERRKEDASPGFTCSDGLLQRVADVLLLPGLKDWEEGFLKELRRRLVAGESVSDDQVRKLGEIEHERAQRPEDARPTPNVPTSDQAAAKLREELAHAEQCVRERVEDGEPVTPQLQKRLDYLRKRVSDLAPGRQAGQRRGRRA